MEQQPQNSRPSDISSPSSSQPNPNTHTTINQHPNSPKLHHSRTLDTPFNNNPSTPATPSRRKSLQLSQQQKYPEVLVQHHLLQHLHTNPSPLHHSPQPPQPPQPTIAQKSQSQQCDLTMLLGPTPKPQSLECRSQQQYRQELPEPSYYSSNPLTNKGDSPNLSHKSSGSEISKEERELLEIEEEMKVRDNLPEIICRSALFWRKERCEAEDYSRFGKLIRDYIEIRIKPKALNQVGQGLLSNGFFALAFIKYVSMPESSDSPTEQSDNIRSSMFDLFTKQYKLQTNKEEFEEAYRRNQEEELERFERLRRKEGITMADGSESVDLKRDPSIKSRMRSSGRSFKASTSQEETYVNTQEEATQTEGENR